MVAYSQTYWFDVVFLVLQGVVTAFLLLHDWIPLGRLNNFHAMKKEDSLGRRVFVTLLPAVPAGIGLYFSAQHIGQAYPHWLEFLLWISYGLFVVGMLRAWWVPYLFGGDEQRAARYRVIFAGTHRFLPERHGMAPDTLHTVFHVCCLAAFVMLVLRG